MSKFMYWIYIKLFRINRLKKYLVYRIANLEGGEMRSNTIRNYAKDHNVEVDYYTYGYCFSEKFNLGGTVKIGRYCSIAENVRYFGANHPINHVSTSAYFYNKSLGFDVHDVVRNTLEIGNDVWIGYGVIITSNCTKIGNGAIVGAGSVVTKNIDPYTIVAGNPAKEIRKRFSKEEIELIEKSNWWNNKPEKIFDFYPLMGSPIVFINELLKDEII